MSRLVSQSIHTLALLLLSGLLFTACDSSSPGDVDGEITIDDIDTEAILTSEANDVILATYTELETDASTLNGEIDAFVSSPSAEGLQSAQDAWIATRTPWESSESFLFGPVAEDDLDPALDSWPVDETSIQQVLDGNQEVTPNVVRNLGNNSKGFHTIEFLLFGPNGDKTVNDFTQREYDYLSAATIVLAEDTKTLADAWRDGYAANFAATQVTTAQSPKAALDVLAEGIEIIADEVGTGKIGTPLSDNTIARVESKYSENSFSDFANNMRSIRAIYTGDYAGNTGPGLDDVVGRVNPELDSRMKAQIEEAITRIEEIPMSFRKAIEQGDTADVQAAQEAIIEVRTIVQEEIRPLIGNL